MPVIRFIEGGPDQLNGAYAELAGHEDAEYLEFAKSKLAEHALFSFAYDFVDGRPATEGSRYASGSIDHAVDPEEPSAMSSVEIADQASAVTRFLKALNGVNPEKIQPKLLKSLVALTRQVEESGIAMINKDNQMISAHDGTVDTESIDFKGAVREIGDYDSKTRDQDIEIARLVAKEDLDTQAYTVQPGKSVDHDQYAFGRFTSHKSVGKTDEAGNYVPFATVLAEAPKSDGTMKFGRDIKQDGIDEALLADPIASEFLVEDIETDPETPYFPPARIEPVIPEEQPPV